MRKFFIRRIAKGSICSALALTMIITGVDIPFMRNNGSAIVAEAATIRKCYTIRNSNTRVYSNKSLTSGKGWIYPSDEVTVYTVTDKYCYVGYPISNGTKEGYISTSAILLSTGGSTYKNNGGSFNTYKRIGGEKYGISTKGDSITILGTSGNYTQIKYPISGGYKYAFALTSDINRYVKGNSSISSGGSTSITSAQAKAVMFNATYYANTYSDLKAAFGYDSTKLYNHYITCGIKEGRSASPIFDPVYYLNNNSDLKRAFGSNYTSAYSHWISYGCAEGRASSRYYNGAYYRNKYSDLQRAYFSSGSAANSYYNLAKHYLTYGIGERRWANSNGYLPSGMGQAGSSSSSVNNSTYSVSNNLLTVNGVAMSDYRIGGKYTNSNYATINGKQVYMAGSQCCGYARYIAYKLYGCHDKSAPGKFKDVSGYVAAGSLTTAKLKSAVTAAGVGSHIRTNGSQHSLSIIGVTDSGFTITDANSDGKLTIRVATYTWSSYVNSKYGKRGLAYIKKYVG